MEEKKHRDKEVQPLQRKPLSKKEEAVQSFAEDNPEVIAGILKSLLSKEE